MKNPFVPFSIAMITPFSENGELYLKGIPSLIDYYKKHDVPALLISGSTGEQHSMTIEERTSLFHAVKKETKNDLLLYGGVAAVQTKDAMALAISAEEAELDAIMLGFPPYVRINQQEAFSYVERICSVTNLPIMIYNNPVRTGFNLQVETLITLAMTFPQIVAFKEAGNSNNVPIVKKQLGAEFNVLSGFDLKIFEDAKLGFDGITSVLGNIFPVEIQKIIKAVQSGKEEEGKKHLTEISPYMNSILEMGTLRPIKYLLEKQNIQAGVCREPLSALSVEEKKIIDKVFQSF
ncbi:dihydrodipicolinate synthase family protein [Bacillus atrophaeus]|uniref:dihydrodipicolinate synthase family protein n=1 Tax=Bacillus atrophaeus TaxID=1452 RepID=UPI000B92AC03|nr:dihydrodipicolinate synthase family protein [Bacillus atrophaeus]ASS69702.1 dihydrodipicolinate synthase family protein [Bacillus atrophaeus]MDS9999123.1 dihydrodipicolinate synthase family protein [Bacillus atrophaeus]QUF65632.1 dihydrodipicolinate synthase family protein [Bacillus atrophaeus]